LKFLRLRSVMDEFFLPLTKVFVFGIVDEGAQHCYDFIWDEHGKMDPHSVISCLQKLFSLNGELRRVPLVVINCDGCTKENRNNYILFYWAWRVHEKYHDEVRIQFMYRGHTRFSPDQNFGVIRNNWVQSTVYTLEDCLKYLRKENTCSTTTLMEMEDFHDYDSHRGAFRNWGAITKQFVFRIRRNANGEVQISSFSSYDSIEPTEVREGKELLKRGVEGFPDFAFAEEAPWKTFTLSRQHQLYSEVLPHIPVEKKEEWLRRFPRPTETLEPYNPMRRRGDRRTSLDVISERITDVFSVSAVPVILDDVSDVEEDK